MLHYNVWQLSRVVEFLVETELRAEFEQAGDRGESRVPDERMNTCYVPMLKYCRTQCEQLELSAALARFDHFNHEIRQGISWSELRNQAKVLHEAIHTDLAYRRFAFVPTSKASIHDKFGLIWEDIWKKIPDAKEDSERAIDCYALGQDTACVFHLMRVAEMGLRALAKQLRVTITHRGKVYPIEYGDWDKVITGIKNKITLARSLPVGPKRQNKLEFYSDAAEHCLFMKDIWRNNVSHARKRYEDFESLAVLGRVQGFMHFLAISFSLKTV